MKYYVKIFPMDWWGYYSYSKSFRTYKAALNWAENNLRPEEDYEIIQEFPEVLFDEIHSYNN